MSARSKKQQKFFGMVHGLQKGTTKPSDVSSKVKKVAKSIKKADAEDFASTKHKGLPTKVDESDGYTDSPEELKVKNDAVQSGMPKTRERRMKENYTIKLKDLLEEGWMDDENQITEEDKLTFLEAVRSYNQYGKQVYREGNLIELAEKLAKICKMAETFALQETNDWFDDVTIKRNMGELKKLGVNFQKVATEVQSVQDRMVGLYEDMGNILGRYFEIEELEEELDQDKKKVWPCQHMAEDEGLSVGDRVKVNLKMLQQHSNVRPYLKLVYNMVRQGGGTALVVDMEDDVARLAANEADAELGTVKVPVAVLKKVVKRESITE